MGLLSRTAFLPLLSVAVVAAVASKELSGKERLASAEERLQRLEQWARTAEEVLSMVSLPALRDTLRPSDFAPRSRQGGVDRQMALLRARVAGALVNTADGNVCVRPPPHVGREAIDGVVAELRNRTFIAVFVPTDDVRGGFVCVELPPATAP